MATNIQNVESRNKLSPRRAPYWQRISRGCQLGYRRMSTATAGVWWAQVYSAEQGQTRQPLGTFDHLPAHQRFDAAKRAAEDLFAHVSQGGTPVDMTLRQACESYVAHLRGEGRETAANDASSRFNRFVYGDALAAVNLRKLTAQQLRKWRHQLIARPVVVNPYSAEQITRERSPASVNRDMTSLRAALNLAHENGVVTSDAAWRSALRPIEAASGRRTLYLDRKQRAALIKHASPDVAVFLRGLALLPLRPGALAAMTVENFDKQLGVLTIGKDKAGVARSIGLPKDTAQLFAELAANKPATAPLLCRADGLPWSKDAWKKPVKAAAAAAELPATVTAYTLRHSVITDLIVNGLDTLTVARLAGTSLAMIDKHYGHLSARHASAALAKLAL